VIAAIVANVLATINQTNEIIYSRGVQPFSAKGHSVLALVRSKAKDKIMI